ncbi:hypothetical protein C7B70_17690 [Chlorogloea sp. CCALA 695]|nr:hypothetical protein C7B70_17690 [Chlorogloea sp. CCALA 695]
MQLPLWKLVATNVVQIKEGKVMFPKLMLAVTMTFALNLLLEINPPANTQTAIGARVDFAKILKVRIIGLASISNDK